MTGTVKMNAPAKESRLRMVVLRADGRVEDLGTVAYYHRNPLRQSLFKAWIAINRFFGRTI